MFKTFDSLHASLHARIYVIIASLHSNVMISLGTRSFFITQIKKASNSVIVGKSQVEVGQVEVV